MFEIVHTSKYKKDRALLVKQGKDMSKLDVLEKLIASGVQIPSTYKPHKLVDSKHFKQCFECHVTSPTDDWVVIYQFGTISGNDVVGFIRTGSHSRIFKEFFSRTLDYVSLCRENRKRVPIKLRQYLESFITP